MRKIKHIHLILFLVTFVFVTISGAEWIYGSNYFFTDRIGWQELKKGLLFSVPFLGFLTTHEFGHYFMAKYRKVKVTLPYYIPVFFFIATTIGTAGAFIQIKDRIKKKTDYFDIGIAGPLAGFVVALGVLIYGYANLPGLDFLFEIHPEYEIWGAEYGNFAYESQPKGMATRLGNSLLSMWVRGSFADPTLIPHENELIHYPFIFAGYLGCFFTALNLLPIGQLDGGHILYAMIGKKAFNKVSPVFFCIFLFFGGLGFYKIQELSNLNSTETGSTLLYFPLYVYFNYLCCSRISKNKLTNWIIALTIVFLQLLVSFINPEIEGYSGFLFFAFLLGRLLGIYHPSTIDKQALDPARILLGVVAIIIFIVSFSPYPLY